MKNGAQSQQQHLKSVFDSPLRYQLLLFGLHLLLYLKRFVDARRGVANRYWFLVEAKEIKKALLRVSLTAWCRFQRDGETLSLQCPCWISHTPLRTERVALHFKTEATSSAVKCCGVHVLGCLVGPLWLGVSLKSTLNCLVATRL